MKQALMELSRALGVCGDESGAVTVAKKYLAPLVDEVCTDHMGNLFGIRRNGDPAAKTILLDAHLDEVGMIVTGHDGTRLKLGGGVGGIDPRMLPGLSVWVLADTPLPGVILGELPEDAGKAASMDALRIDCGLTEEAAKEISVGTRVSYGTKPWMVGDRVFGKSLDDRACFVALMYALEQTKDERLPVNVVLQGSAQEERGGVGALTGTFRIQPDVAVVSDVTFGDSPDSPKAATFPLGSGAAIGFSPVLDRTLTRKLRDLAERENIPHVSEVMEDSTGTNSMETQIAGTGVPSVLISMPLRYMHTPVEEIDWKDVEAVGRLVASFLRHFGEVSE